MVEEAPTLLSLDTPGKMGEAVDYCGAHGQRGQQTLGPRPDVRSSLCNDVSLGKHRKEMHYYLRRDMIVVCQYDDD
jgi:hypothetical protein